MTGRGAAFFGTDAQQVLLARAKALFDVVRGDPRFSYYGRTVGLVTPDDGDMSLLQSLVALQGSANYSVVDASEAGGLVTQAQATGLSVTRYNRWSGGKEAHSAARQVLAGKRLPADVEVLRIAPDTPDAEMAAFARMALDCGVLPPVRQVLDGRDRSGLCYVARNRSGEIVSCAAGAAIADPSHPVHGGMGWWGMLATRPDHRGAGLSLIFGAHALIGLLEEKGLTSVFTGCGGRQCPVRGHLCADGARPRTGRDALACRPGAPAGRAHDEIAVGPPLRSSCPAGASRHWRRLQSGVT